MTYNNIDIEECIRFGIKVTKIYQGIYFDNHIENIF